ncbi:MAG TPA: hypothetical protein VH877_12980 [Polyangia bacterium]|nr:hypothetical protein [Polyangia bacterium]
METAALRPGTAGALRRVMLDLVFISLTVAFFAASWALARGCERL